MIDHTRIQSDYDVEILFGSDYFHIVLSAAYDSGEIPSAVTVGDVSLQLQRPSVVNILVDSQYADIEVTVPVALEILGIPYGSHDVVIQIQVDITEADMGLAYVSLDQATIDLIGIAEDTSGIPGILEQVEQQLREILDRRITFDLLSPKLADVELPIAVLHTKKIAGDGGYQDVFGLYVNFGMKVVRPPLDPDTFWPRGNLSNAQSFLPADRSYAIGFNKATFERFGNDTWNRFALELPDGSIQYDIHPVLDGTEVIGHYKNLKITPRNGYIRLVIRMQIYIDGWPDADVEARWRFTVSVPNGSLKVDSHLHYFDADTGLLGNILGFVAGFLLGAFIGGVIGVSVFEFWEEGMANSYREKLEKRSEAIGLEYAFLAFPESQLLFSDQTDPFFVARYKVVHTHDEVHVDTDGMSFAGHAGIAIENEPKEVMLIDKTRGGGDQSWNGLLSLTYRTRTDGDLTLTIQEVLERLSLRKLAQVPLKPTRIRQTNTVVSDIRFVGGLDLHVAESTALQEVGALRVKGFQFIREYSQRNGRVVNAHYRARADDIVENNFESLPRF